MPRLTSFEVSVLNITLQPHSPELYVNLFDTAFSSIPAISKKYYGKEYISVKISDKIYSSDGKNVHAIFGYIQKYTIIDSNSWYDKYTDSKAEEGEEPDYDMNRFSPYFTSYEFVFLPRGHRMFILTKLKNDTLSIARVANALESIFNIRSLIDKFNKVIVNVEHDEASIDKLLSMSILQKIFIKVSLDNDDDISDIKQKVIDRMRKQSIHTISQNLTGEKNKTINPDEETIALMELSLSNGYSIVNGERNGQKVVEKTSFYPHVIRQKYNSNLESMKEELVMIANRDIEYFRTRQRDEN